MIHVSIMGSGPPTPFEPNNRDQQGSRAEVVRPTSRSIPTASHPQIESTFPLECRSPGTLNVQWLSGPPRALLLHGERQRPILALHGVFARGSDCIPHSARVSTAQFLGQALRMPVVIKNSVQGCILSCNGLDDKCQVIPDTEKCHEIADSCLNALECLSVGR